MKGSTYTAQEYLSECFDIDRCPECHCYTSNDTEYMSNKAAAICAQCGYEWWFEIMEEDMPDGKDTLVSLTRILDVCGLDDTLWVLRCTTNIPAAEKLARLFTCDCAWHVLKYYEREYPTDKRVRECIKTTRRFANGLASQKELEDAQEAAWAAALAAQDAAQAAWAAETKWQTSNLRKLLEVK